MAIDVFGYKWSSSVPSGINVKATTTDSDFSEVGRIKLAAQVEHRSAARLLS